MSKFWDAWDWLMCKMHRQCLHERFEKYIVIDCVHYYGMGAGSGVFRVAYKESHCTLCGKTWPEGD